MAESYKRKLSAILSADVEGYSRLMGEDEDITIKTLTTYRELMTTLITKHRGRVVDSPGDNLLAEFLSVVDAVRCAVEIQEELRIRNAEFPETKRMHFRIGINLGDVVEEGERIYGDGINIAARVEGLAEGGGICISGTVYDSIKNKLSLSYESLGEHTVKNITEPVRVYRMRVGPEATAPVEREEKPHPKLWRKAALAALVVLIVAAGTWAIWNFYFRPPPIEPASVEKMAYPLPEKPSIAVLPFTNLSGDPEQEYIADGISENIITALSHIPRMFVIARNSSFTYKGKPVKVQQVSEELGVRYILEGSVFISEEKIRITAQLIDALTGGHLWSERYDRDFKDLLPLLDEITLAIGVALQVELTEGEQARIVTTDNLDAWRYVNKGTGIFLQFSKEAMIKSRELFKKALEIDPEYAGALTMLAWTHWNDAYRGYTDSRRESFTRAVELAKKSVALDDSQPLVHELLLYIYLVQKQHGQAIEEGRKSIALGPNRARGHNFLCEALYRSGHFEEAVQMCEKAIRLHPYAPPLYLINLCTAYYWVGRYEESLVLAEQVIGKGKKTGARMYERWGYWCSARANVRLGRESEARDDMAKFLEIAPGHNMEADRRNTLYKPEIIEQEHAVMRKAGFPETPPLPLPDKPSIAVLPFTNMSDDPEQEYFSDGITEEIITALSKTPKLFVIARTSSFKYKSKDVDVRTVGRELGVRYVVEGSIRKSKDRLRITAQLVDTKTGNHLWAERYDREMKDIFDIQDDITKRVITEVQVQLTAGEEARFRAKGTNNLNAYLKFLEGWEASRHWNKEASAKARKLAEEVIALDPEYQKGHFLLATVEVHDIFLGLSKSPKDALIRAIDMAKRSIAIEDSSFPHHVLAVCYNLLRKHEVAISEAKKAVEIAPSYADGYMILGHVLWLSDMAEKAVPVLQKAIRLNPYPPSQYFHNLAFSYHQLGRYEEAIIEAKKAIHVSSKDTVAYRALISSYALLGREDAARSAAAELLRIDPDFSVDSYAKRTPFKNKVKLEQIVTSFRLAGLK